MTATPKWLRGAARRSAERSWSLGMLLKEYAAIEGLNEAQLANTLGCDIGVLDWLSLCRCPSMSKFEDDIQLICARFNLEPGKLAHVVRSVQVLKDMRERSSVAGQERFLLAARDRDE